MKISVLFCGLLLAAAPVGSGVFAATAPGLWSNSLQMTMPGMPAMDPAMLAQMQAMGIQIPGMGAPIVTQVCITPAQASGNVVPPPNRNCTVSNQRLINGGRTIAGDVTCTGEYAGTGTFEATYDSATHMTQKITMQSARAPGAMTIDIEGTRISADCGTVAPVGP